MFEWEYCSGTDFAVPYHGNRRTEDDEDERFSKEYEDSLAIIDQYQFLTELYMIVDSCKNDIISNTDNHGLIWTNTNKYVMNYLNAIYSYKEYLDNYRESLADLTDQYYQRERWYRFVLEYRNRLIHQSVFIKNINPDTGDVFIDMDELLEKQQRIIEEKKGIQRNDIRNNKNGSKNQKIKKLQGQIDSAIFFMEILKEITETTSLITEKGHRLYSVKELVTNVQPTLEELNNNILLILYEKQILPKLNYFLSLIHKDDRKYYYTFIVNHEWHLSKEKKYYAVCEPTLAVETFFFHIFKNLGSGHKVIKNMMNFFDENNYTYSFEKNCLIQDCIEKCENNAKFVC